MEASHNVYSKLRTLLYCTMYTVNITSVIIKIPITTTAIKVFKANLQ